MKISKLTRTLAVLGLFPLAFLWFLMPHSGLSGLVRLAVYAVLGGLTAIAIGQAFGKGRPSGHKVDPTAPNPSDADELIEDSAPRRARQAADVGSPEAQFHLATMYGRGEGVTQDDALAVRWYRRAAEQGYAAAQCAMGDCYKDGKGVSMDLAQAAAWYERAAVQGDAPAQMCLGYLCGEGLGVIQDHLQAAEWYQCAAEQGEVFSQRQLGYMYLRGVGVPLDQPLAVAWFKRAAGQGYALAQFNLGSLYAKGEALSQDVVSAHMWWTLASDQGHEGAKQARDDLEAFMSDDEIVEAQHRALEFVELRCEESADVRPTGEADVEYDELKGADDGAKSKQQTAHQSSVYIEGAMRNWLPALLCGAVVAALFAATFREEVASPNKSPRIVARTWWGGCPQGYVDDPRNPQRCVVPILAARLLNNAGRNEVTRAVQDDNSASRFHPLDVRNPQAQQAYEAESARIDLQRLERQQQEFESRQRRLERDANWGR